MKLNSMDSLGDRMKSYEALETSRVFMSGLPVIVRIDGKNFHTYTKGFERPFDFRMKVAMLDTTKRLVEETNAVIGYTQSDEITLVLPDDRPILFEGRIFKLVSFLASLATMTFNRSIAYEQKRYATFDCRCFQVPNRAEAVNCLIWRELDAIKNSVSALAQKYFSHRQLEGKNSDDKKAMLAEKGVNWIELEPYFRKGSFVRRRVFTRKFTAEELQNLPPKHNARLNPDTLITRSEMDVVNYPYYIKDTQNRVDVIYNDAPPCPVERKTTDEVQGI